MIKATQFGLWAIEKHRDTNHFYDDNLPYDYHLSLAVKSAYRYRHLVGDNWIWIQDAVFGHDLIEDSRVSYNDIVKYALICGHSPEIAIKIGEAIRACTNYGRGRNRDERMPAYIYNELRTTEGATFIKVAGDRIANVKHGMISESDKLDMYRKEQPKFRAELYIAEHEEIWNYLDMLLKIQL